ncbi:nuclear transport factor 2 family protein [Acidicapsa dinghuensis]|uniref:Nuclear transport factor 2 family protein n=1 Tax=Acidicapsa dinghuensis TaxID=2218256 RepID=A0ABW1EP71_9BACT|nr:nuclear transport factor 2 family protein [Acidicapsa dinghuensis]
MTPARTLFHSALAVAFLACALPSPAAVASTPEEDAVLAPVHQLFNGMSAHDGSAIKASAIPGANMILMRDGKPHQMTIESFADRLSKPSPDGKDTPIEESIHDPLVRIDNDLAVVWAPFEFLSNGKVDHCGTDLFNLIRVDGKWLIASVADTGRKDCPAQ